MLAQSELDALMPPKCMKSWPRRIVGNSELRDAVIDNEMLPRRDHQERRGAVLPQNASVRVGGRLAHNGVELGHVAVSGPLAPFLPRAVVNVARVGSRAAGQMEDGRFAHCQSFMLIGISLKMP